MSVRPKFLLILLKLFHTVTRQRGYDLRIRTRSTVYTPLSIALDHGRQCNTFISGFGVIRQTFRPNKLRKESSVERLQDRKACARYTCVDLSEGPDHLFGNFPCVIRRRHEGRHHHLALDSTDTYAVSRLDTHRQLSIMGSYKRPVENMRMTCTFCRFGICNAQTIRTGRSRTIKSRPYYQHARTNYMDTIRTHDYVHNTQ